MQNVIAKRVEVKFNLILGAYVLIKLFLRGIESTSYVPSIIGELQQTPVGKRCAVQITGHGIEPFTIIAVRKSADTGVVVTGWSDLTIDIGERAKSLISMLYNIMFNGLSSWDIKKEKRCVKIKN